MTETCSRCGRPGESVTDPAERLTWVGERDRGRLEHGELTRQFGRPEALRDRGAENGCLQRGTTLRAALADEGVSIIACPVDYSENLRLTERLGQLDDTL